MSERAPSDQAHEVVNDSADFLGGNLMLMLMGMLMPMLMRMASFSGGVNVRPEYPCGDDRTASGSSATGRRPRSSQLAKAQAAGKPPAGNVAPPILTRKEVCDCQ